MPLSKDTIDFVLMRGGTSKGVFPVSYTHLTLPTKA